MRIVCIESPFKPSVEDIARYQGKYSEAELLRQNLVYAQLALADSLARGETPFAAHLLYSQVCEERDSRMFESAIAFHHRADLIVLSVDLGVSNGMRLASDNAKLIDTELVTRTILDDRDPRKQLAHYKLGSFLELEELQRKESADRKPRGPQLAAPGRVIPFRRPANANA